MKMIFGRKVAFFTFNREPRPGNSGGVEVARLEEAEFELLWESLPV